MRAIDFLSEGVRFEHFAGRLFVHGPADRPDLRTALEAEVARRFPRMLADEMPRIEGLPRTGFCDSCGDEMLNGRGGVCPLCALARRKAMIAMGRYPTRDLIYCDPRKRPWVKTEEDLRAEVASILAIVGPEGAKDFVPPLPVFPELTPAAPPARTARRSLRAPREAA